MISDQTNKKNPARVAARRVEVVWQMNRVCSTKQPLEVHHVGRLSAERLQQL
jgi:hypothetical protein